MRLQVRPQRAGKKKPRMKHEDLRQGEEGGMHQKHYPCGHIHVTTFIYSETLFSKELLVHERGRGGNKVNYIS